MSKQRNKALLFAGTNTGLLNFHVTLASKPATEEFSYISPALITSNATKRGGVIKYIDNKCVCAVKYHNIRPADLLGEVINDANRVNLTIGRPDFGNYEAGAN